MPKWLSFIIKLAVSVALIAFIATNFDIGEATERLLNLSPLFVVLSALLFVLLMVNNTLRWWLVVSALQTPLKFWTTFRLLYIGIFFNQTLPSSVGGDAVRMYLARKEGMSLQTAINSVLLERVATVCGLIILVVASQPFLLSRIGDNPAKYAFPLLAALAVIGIAVLMLMDKIPERFHSWKLVRGLVLVSQDTKALFSKPGLAFAAIGLGVLGFIIISVVAFFLALSLDIPISLVDSLVLIPPVMLITTIPISIAGWGVREGAMVAAFALISVPEGDAFVLSLLFGLLNFAAALPGGIIWLSSGYTRKDVAEDLPPS